MTKKMLQMSPITRSMAPGSRATLLDGVTLVDLGGPRVIHLRERVNVCMPGRVRAWHGWYTAEQFGLLALCLPELFGRDLASQQEEMVRHSQPDLYEQALGVTILPTRLGSKEKHRKRWLKQHRYDWLEVTSWNDSDPNVARGMVLIKAALGSDAENGTTYFLVPAQEYLRDRGEYGFVCDPRRHQECHEVT